MIRVRTVENYTNLEVSFRESMLPPPLQERVANVAINGKQLQIKSHVEKNCFKPEMKTCID